MDQGSSDVEQVIAHRAWIDLVWDSLGWHRGGPEGAEPCGMAGR